MKKFVGLCLAALIAVPMFTACSISSPKVQLTTAMDSLNYAFGAANGYAIRQSVLGADTTKGDVKAFVKGFTKGYKEQDESFKDFSDGMSVGLNLQQQLDLGFLVGDSAIKTEPKVVYTAIYSVLKDAKDYMFTQEEAYTYVTNAINRSRDSQGKVVFTAAEIDSINTAFGLHNGYQIKQYFLANDSTGKAAEEFIKGLKKVEKSSKTTDKLYLQGLQIGAGMYKELKENGIANEKEFTVDLDMMKAALINAVTGENCLMTNEDAYQYFMQRLMTIRTEPGKKFLEENAKKDGVVVTESGLQYKVLTLGNGPVPTAEDKVKVNYEGRLIDGTVFDSSFERGEPIVFQVTQVIPGWTEALQLMPVGSTYEIYIPYNLGYGERGAGDAIPPYAALIFKVELLGIEK